MRTKLELLRLGALVVISLMGLAAFAAPASAGGPPALTGAVGPCQPDGTFTITWTLEDFLGPDYLFEITGTELSGAVTGTVDFVPTSLNAAGATAVGMTVLAGSTVGDVFLDVNFLVTFVPEQEQFDDSSAAVVTSTGGCAAPTPSTDGSTTTSVAAGAATRPTFTG